MIPSVPTVRTSIVGAAAMAHSHHPGRVSGGSKLQASRFSVAPDRNTRLKRPAPVNAASPMPTAARLRAG